MDPRLAHRVLDVSLGVLLSSAEGLASADSFALGR